MKNKCYHRLLRVSTLTLAVLMVLGSAAASGYALTLRSAAADDAIAAAAPTGYVNVATGATVTVSKCSAAQAGNANSYEMPSENWALRFLIDGKLNTGWSTNPYDKEMNADAPVTLDFRLDKAYELSAIAMFPGGRFPVDYQVSVSADGNTYTIVADVKGASVTGTDPVVHTFNPVTASYVRIHCTKRIAVTGGDGCLVQLAQVAIYGKTDLAMEIDRPNIELLVGETDTLKTSFTGKVDDASVTWKSSDTSVVTVDASGKLTAKKLGSATITATSASTGLRATCKVDVVEKKLDLDENIMISIFWPPTQNYINDEQYKLIADAGVNWIMGAGEETLATEANQKKILELCAKYGIHVIVNDGRFGGGLASKSDTVIANQVADYKNATALGGFYILDEPMNANGYVKAYLALKKAFPEGYMHLNFLPSGCYGSEEIYKAQMNDWCRLCAAGGYPVDYLIYDRYPFPLAAGSMDRAGFYRNMRSVHDIALKNDVRTGTYIQTVCQEVAFRRPTDSEIRYEMYSALAFGFKQLSFFTWFTPVNRSEPFADGIISADGVPNAHYEAIKTINHEILAIGSTLVKCDALEVYLNGTDTYGQPSIPSDFFVQPGKKTQSYTVSWLRHKETGRNYLMVVNNNFSKEQTINLKLDSKITAIYEVSKTDGSLSPLTITDNQLELKLAAGDAIFMALPEGVDFLEKNDAQPDAGVNLALDAIITCSESKGADGYYMYFLNDGQRFSSGGANGWRSDSQKDSNMVIDLGAERTFNRVDLYPSGNLFNYAETFPAVFKISVSTDGKTYKEVASRSGVAAGGDAMAVTFDGVTARYIKIDITACNGKFASLCEVEVYNDNGSVPAPEKYQGMAGNDEVVVYTEGMDLAFKKPVYPSSTTPDAGYRDWGWAADYINNGKEGQGWTSNVKVNTSPDSTEYMIIDLQDVFAIDHVDVTTMGVFPENFAIRMSVDGRNWTDIVSVTGAPSYAGGTKLTFSREDGQPVVGRFLCFIGTRLRGTTADGYMLQLGKISAYGTPVCDKATLTDAMALFKEYGGDETAAAFTAVQAAMDEPYLTQSQANKLASDLLALVDIPEPDTEPETDPVTEPVTDPETDPVTEPITDPVTDPTIEPSSDPVTTPATGAPEDVTTAAPAPGTTPATDAETDKPSGNGCASAIGAAATASLVALAAGAVVLRKKKEEE